jgi:hypothetical protein
MWEECIVHVLEEEGDIVERVKGYAIGSVGVVLE